MKINSFQELRIWKLADELFNMIYEDSKNFPKDFTSKVITDQLIRSISSISANIAEGCGRGSRKEFIRYLVIARGSLVESQNWLIKMRKMRWLAIERYQDYENKLLSEQKMVDLSGKLKLILTSKPVKQSSSEFLMWSKKLKMRKIRLV